MFFSPKRVEAKPTSCPQRQQNWVHNGPLVPLFIRLFRNWICFWCLYANRYFNKIPINSFEQFIANSRTTFVHSGKANINLHAEHQRIVFVDQRSDKQPARTSNKAIVANIASVTWFHLYEYFSHYTRCAPRLCALPAQTDGF